MLQTRMARYIIIPLMLCIIAKSDATFLKKKLLKGGLGGGGGQQGCEYSGGPLGGGGLFSGGGNFGSGFGGFAPVKMPMFGMGWTRMLSCAMARPWMSLGYPMMQGGGSWNNNIWPGSGGGYTPYYGGGGMNTVGGSRYGAGWPGAYGTNGGHWSRHGKTNYDNSKTHLTQQPTLPPPYVITQQRETNYGRPAPAANYPPPPSHFNRVQQQQIQQVKQTNFKV